MLENGRISQRGTHETLMWEAGMYRRLVEEQARLEQMGEEGMCRA